MILSHILPLSTFSTARNGGKTSRHRFILIACEGLSHVLAPLESGLGRTLIRPCMSIMIIRTEGVVARCNVPLRSMQNTDSMNMVGHDDECTQFDIGAYLSCAQSFFTHNFIQFVQRHLPIHHLAKQTGPILGHDGDEIRTLLSEGGRAAGRPYILRARARLSACGRSRQSPSSTICDQSPF